MNISDLQRNWDAIGKSDPMWSILTDPNKKGRKWDRDEFFATGKNQVDSLMASINSLNIKKPHKRALDFGCGIGRLTQALCRYFDNVSGVDIAPSMIRLAKRYNRYNNKCDYFVNATSNLKIFPDNTFDFIYSSLTLMHIRPRYSSEYIKDFIRILVPNGLVIFDLLSKPGRTTKGFIYRFTPRFLFNAYRKIKHGSVVEIHWIKQSKVIQLVEQNGGELLDVRKLGKGKDFEAFEYCFTKRQGV